MVVVLFAFDVAFYWLVIVVVVVTIIVVVWWFPLHMLRVQVRCVLLTKK